MGIRDRLDSYIVSAVNRVKGVTIYPNWALSMAEQERHNIPSMSLPQRQAELYQRLSWVAIAVGHVANEAAGTPFEVLRDIGEDTESIVNHEFEQLLKRPNPTQSRFEFLESTFLWRLLTGNAYWWLNKTNENAPPSEIWSIPSYKIDPVPDGNLYLRGYLYDPGNGNKIMLEPWEVVHFKRFNPFNPYVGMSPVEALATVSVGDLKMQEWNTNFFGKENAKMPGILGFSDPIPDPDWERLQNDVTSQHGGTKRNLMMLRNVGAGGVNWVSTSMSQKDMEFLAARQFNRQEIFDMFAPGLAQWLSPDTTNANAGSGRDALMELAVWPIHQSISETIANKVLPVYGDNLVCEFEDVRPRDRAMVLQEQSAYALVHTIDEVRSEYYSAPPLGDERGTMLVAEVTAAGIRPEMSDAVDESAAQADEQQPEDTAKAKERDQFRRFAQKRIDEGSPEKVANFRFDVLSPPEQLAIQAEYIEITPDYAPLVTKLTEAIETMRALA
jgi:HK97 family phage portal protein